MKRNSHLIFLTTFLLGSCVSEPLPVAGVPTEYEDFELGFFDEASDYLDTCGLIDFSKITTNTVSGMGADYVNYNNAQTGDYLYYHNLSYDFWGSYSDYGQPFKNVVVNAKLPSTFKENDRLLFRWFSGEWVEGHDENDPRGHYEYKMELAEEEAFVLKCGDQLFVTAIKNFSEPVYQENSNYKVELYFGDTLIDGASLSLQAQ